MCFQNTPFIEAIVCNGEWTSCSSDKMCTATIMRRLSQRFYLRVQSNHDRTFGGLCHFRLQLGQCFNASLCFVFKPSCMQKASPPGRNVLALLSLWQFSRCREFLLCGAFLNLSYVGCTYEGILYQQVLTRGLLWMCWTSSQTRYPSHADLPQRFPE